MVKSKNDILVGASYITMSLSVYAFSHNTLPMPKLAPELKDSTFTNKDESICILNMAQMIQKLLRIKFYVTKHIYFLFSFDTQYPDLLLSPGVTVQIIQNNEIFLLINSFYSKIKLIMPHYIQ